MMDRDKVIKALECCTKKVCIYNDTAKKCPYWELCGDYESAFEDCTTALAKDALALLKAQEPRLVTEADFENADPYGYLPVWVEDKDDKEIICDCITKHAITEPDEDYHYRYWTSRPDEKRRAETPWMIGFRGRRRS